VSISPHRLLLAELQCVILLGWKGQPRPSDFLTVTFGDWDSTPGCSHLSRGWDSAASHQRCQAMEQCRSCLENWVVLLAVKSGRAKGESRAADGGWRRSSQMCLLGQPHQKWRCVQDPAGLTLSVQRSPLLTGSLISSEHGGAASFRGHARVRGVSHVTFPCCCQPQRNPSPMNPSLIITQPHASRIEHQRWDCCTRGEVGSRSPGELTCVLSSQQQHTLRLGQGQFCSSEDALKML